MTIPIILPENAKAIPLTQGKYAIVDTEDYDWLMQWKWYCNGGKYATRVICFPRKKGETRKFIRFHMHREIIKTPINMYTDHINGDGLDNRKCNLRVCNLLQNSQNMKKKSNTISSYKGVHFVRDVGINMWATKIQVNKKQIYLGCFPSEIEAATTYNNAALEYFGEFAWLNII